MSGFGPSASPGDFTIAASAAVSNVIDGGGRALAGLIFPAAGWTGTGFSIKEGLNTTTLMSLYDSAGSAVAVTTPASASAAIMVKLDPTKYHTMQFCQLSADSSAAASTVVKPVWTRYNPKG
jgi:hypothetical protein